MRRGRGSWWAHLLVFIVYGALGLASAGVALWVSSPFKGPLRGVIIMFLFLLGVSLIEFRVASEVEGEEDP